MAEFNNATEWLRAVCKLQPPVHHSSDVHRRMLSFTGGGVTHAIPLTSVVETGSFLPRPLRESIKTPDSRDHFATLIGFGNLHPGSTSRILASCHPGTISRILASCYHSPSLIDADHLQWEISRWSES